MSNNDSLKPSDQDEPQATGKRWQTRLLEYSLFILAFIALSSWLNRHLLDDGSQIPELQLPALDQASGQLSWPAEDQQTLVYLFAPWCSVCRISMPGLNLLPRDDLRVVAIALDWNSRGEVDEFITDVGYDGEVLLGDERSRELFKVSGYPSYYVLDKYGQVIHQDRGLSTPPGLWLRTQL